MVRLSALRTDRLYPENAELTPGYGVAGRIMSIKNSSHTIGNRDRDPPACNAVLNQQRHCVSPEIHTVTVLK